MFSDYLYPSESHNDQLTDKYKFVKKSSYSCSVCNCNCQHLYTTYIHKKQITTKTCYLCHIIINFKKYYANKIFLIESKISQQQINNNIIEYYNEFEEIPTPDIIDTQYKIINNINATTYMLNYNSDKNIKIYFNPNIKTYLKETSVNMFTNTKSEDTSIDHKILLNLEFYNKLQQNKKSKKHLEFEHKNNDINKANKNLTNKIKNTEHLYNVKTCLSKCTLTKC